MKPRAGLRISIFKVCRLARCAWGVMVYISALEHSSASRDHTGLSQRWPLLRLFTPHLEWSRECLNSAKWPLSSLLSRSNRTSSSHTGARQKQASIAAGGSVGLSVCRSASLGRGWGYRNSVSDGTGQGSPPSCHSLPQWAAVHCFFSPDQE